MTLSPTDARADGIALVPVRSPDDILPGYRGTPVEMLLAAHSLGRAVPAPPSPQMIVATCMDHRVALRLPERFAFVIRTAGAHTDLVQFDIACAVSVADIRTVAVVGHTDCAMVDVGRHREKFVDTVTALGPATRDEAERLFRTGAGRFGPGDAATRTLEQCRRLRRLLPEVLICPLFLDVEDGTLSQVAERPAAGKG